MKNAPALYEQELKQVVQSFEVRTVAVGNREFKIRRLRNTTTFKDVTAHDQTHLTVHFSRVVLWLR